MKELEAIKYLNDTCINFLDRTKELYCTVTFTRKRAEILRDNIAEVNNAINRLDSIDNANPSEALECLKHIKKYYIPEPCSAKTYDCLETIKQALLKAQEPKQYLKWEDLEKDRIYKVVLNGNQYELVKRYDDYEYHCDYIILQKEPTVSVFIYEWNKEIFNDLHLERVEE